MTVSARIVHVLRRVGALKWVVQLATYHSTTSHPVLIVSVSLTAVLNGDVTRLATRPGFADPVLPARVPPAGLEHATYRLQGVPGRALCRFQEYQGFLGRGTSFGATVSVSLRLPRTMGAAPVGVASTVPGP